MPQNRNGQNRLSLYYKTSTMKISETLYNINESCGSQLRYNEIQLIAEFAAFFSIEEWVSNQHRWNLQGRGLEQRKITWEDLKLIVEAHKAGALFDKILIRSSSFARVYLAKPLEFQAEIKSLHVSDNYNGDGLRLCLKALKSGLKLQWLHIVMDSNEHLRLFLEDLPTGLKLRKLTIVSFWSDTEVRSIFEKLKPGAALEYLESLDLREYGLNMEGIQFIATSIREGVKLKSLHLSYNWIGERGVVLISKAIAESENKELVLQVKGMKCKQHLGFASGSRSNRF